MNNKELERLADHIQAQQRMLKKAKSEKEIEKHIELLTTYAIQFGIEAQKELSRN